MLAHDPLAVDRAESRPLAKSYPRHSLLPPLALSKVTPQAAIRLLFLLLLLMLFRLPRLRFFLQLISPEEFAAS